MHCSGSVARCRCRIRSPPRSGSPSRPAKRKAGGMFLEVLSMDFDEKFFLVGHDGPANSNVADGKAELKHLDVHHGKTGHGLCIDFMLPNRPVMLLNLTRFAAGERFKLIYTTGEAIKKVSATVVW